MSSSLSQNLWTEEASSAMDSRVTSTCNVALWSPQRRGTTHAPPTVLCFCADLRSLLTRAECDLPWRLRVRLARDVARALSHLHAAEVVHRDIKADNVLLDDSWRCVLADYGFARKARMGVAAAMTMCGTNEYMAPEILWGESYDERADVFSFGCLLWALLARRVPGVGSFMLREARSKFKLDFDALRASLPKEAPQSLINCAVACCAYEPDGRPAAVDIVEWLEDLLRELGGAASGAPVESDCAGVPPPSVLIGKARPAAAGVAAALMAGGAAAEPQAIGGSAGMASPPQVDGESVVPDASRATTT